MGGERLDVRRSVDDFRRTSSRGTANTASPSPSAGYAWAANTIDDLIQVDMETMEIVERQTVGGGNMVGVAVDFEGFVWA